MPFKKLFDADTLNQLYRYTLSLTKDESLSYDLLQSCLEKFLQSGTSALDKIEYPLAYIKRMIRNAFFDEQRKRRFEVDLTQDRSEEYDVTISLAEPTLEDLHIQQQDVEQLLANMNAEERELLYLWAVEEFTFDEISTFKQIAKGTLLSKMHRLKQRIKNELAQDKVPSREALQ